MMDSASSRGSKHSCSDGELSGLEVGGLLGLLESGKGSLVLVEALSGCLGGVLPSEVSGLVLLLGVESLGLVSALLVEDGEHLGDRLSNNL